MRSAARPRVASSTVEVDPDAVVQVAGAADENLRVVEDAVDADLLTRGNHITIRGEASEVSRARRIVQELITLAARGSQITPDTTRRVIQLVDESTSASFAEAT